MNDGAADLLNQCQQRGVESGCRVPLFISGEQAWCYQRAQSFFAASDGAAALVAANPVGMQQPDTAKSLLGRERRLVVIDGWTSLSFDDWLAAAGALRAGGLLCVLCPAPEQWPDVYLQAARQQGFHLVHAHSIQRLVDRARTLSSALWWYQGEPAPACPEFAGRWQPTLPSAGQQEAIAGIQRVVSGRAWRPLVIRSDRGRGKTAALGIAAARLLRDGHCRRIVVCAAQPGAVAAAFKHAAEVLGNAPSDPTTLAIDGGELCYRSVQAVMDEPPQCDLLLVDEAAMLPVPFLRECLLRFPRLVFATTVHGYEGSGRGFDVRFKDILDAERPQWRRQYLSEPLRWSDNDPLEAALNQLFLLDADAIEGHAVGEVTVRQLTPDSLIDNEAQLRAVFGLLVNAHYRTRPQDLQYLLDLPGRIFVAERQGCVTGVCHVLVEGEIDASLADEIRRAVRRPRGHLVAQKLANLGDKPQWVQCPSWRINRIAVAAGQRRNGIGLALLAAVEQAARAHQVGFLSSSFGAEAGLLDFWRRSGFQPLWLGHRRESSSGEYSAIVARPLWADLVDDLRCQRAIFLRDLPLKLPRKAGVRVAVVERLLMDGAADAAPTGEQPSRADIATARRYLAGELTLADSAPALWRLCCLLPEAILAWPQIEREAALGRLLLGHSWSTLSARLGLTGRSEVESVLRGFFARLLTSVERQNR